MHTPLLLFVNTSLFEVYTSFDFTICIYMEKEENPHSHWGGKITARKQHKQDMLFLAEIHNTKLSVCLSDNMTVINSDCYLKAAISV